MLRSREAGFTLMELMIAIAIIGVAAAIAIPSLNMFRNNALATTGTNELVNDLAVARAEAARTGYVVAVCRSSDGATCETAANADWTVGRLIFVDRNSNGAIDSGEAVVRRVPASPAALSISLSDAAVNRIAFSASGMRIRGSSDVVFSVCSDGSTERRVEVSAAGRTQTTRTTNECS